MQKIHLKSYSKINLNLRVIKKLNNGLHKIQSIIAFCKPNDDIFISSSFLNKDTIVFTGKFGKKIKNKNSIYETLQKLRKKKIIEKKYFNIEVYKNIPVGAGLGGGSSNAASLINYFLKKTRFKLKKSSIFNLAKEIGSDVPIVLGKLRNFKYESKNISFIDNKKPLYILLIFPNIFSSTKTIYKKNKIFSKSRKINYFQMNKSNKAIKFLKNEKNDLQKAVLEKYPAIEKVLKNISKIKGCHFSRITGSGSTCIGVFSSKKYCNDGRKLMKKKFPNFWIQVSKTI